MAMVYVPATLDDNGFHKGFKAAETGIYLDSLTESHSDTRTEVLNHVATPIGFIHGYDERLTVSVSGEINNTTGIMAASFGAAFSFTSNVLHDSSSADDFFQDPAEPGGFYLDGASVTQGRDAAKSVSLDFTSYASTPIA